MASSRFLAYVDMLPDAPGCWLWTGALTGGRYGTTHIAGRQIGAHRAAWLLFVGEIPNGYEVCHRCDVTCCVNPAHLFLGTRADNERDKSAKGRQWQQKNREAASERGRRVRRENPEKYSRGDDHYRAKLTSADIPEVRRLHRDGVAQREIARRYGVVEHTIRMVVVGRTWKHVA